MGQLVGEREHLGRFGVGAVYEDQRRMVVAEHEAAKLLGIELPPPAKKTIDLEGRVVKTV